MQIRYFWVIDQQSNKIINVWWYPGAENVGDYVTKHHAPSHHQKVRRIYTHLPNSPKYLQRALAPHLLRGCVKPLWQSQTGQRTES